MARQSIDITGTGPHTIVTPSPSQSILITNLLITFSHDEPSALRVWFWAGASLEAGPLYVTDGGEIRYKSDESDRRYIGAAGVPFRISMDPGLSAAGFVDYDLGSL